MILTLILTYNLLGDIGITQKNYTSKYMFTN